MNDSPDSLDREWVSRALDELSKVDERTATIVRARFLDGMLVDEIAEKLNITPRDVKTRSRIGFAWLHKRAERE
jgi:DNA-directed RNA polymerase specialized sigma24 family protein